MNRRFAASAVTAVAALAATAAITPSADAHRPTRPSTYVLTGDEGGSKFEGIGTDERRGRFYVSETTGGEIHRGSAWTARTHEWLGGDGVDGRFTARGVTTDRAGNVYVAGGPNGIGDDGTDNGRPDLWVYSPSGRLLAALRAPGDNAFLNDVWVGPDGAAYVTNSNAPEVFRVTNGHHGWTMDLWVEASEVIEQQPGFNLGGIVLSPDRRALVVAQGNVGALWRFDLRTRAVTRVETGDAPLLNADGLVRHGTRLTVVRNFSRAVTTLRLSYDARSARLVSDRATDPGRVLTTAKRLAGRTLYVDSKFDEQVATPPYEVVTDPFVW
ncbi:gluconolaconase [Nocardioides sp. GXZ039]|uniref:gluconolaconase n=1 Tax=Nocardioides sp. GXZ039 TaxID=3136018 RepID=UPI0030F3A2A2